MELLKAGKLDEAEQKLCRSTPEQRARCRWTLVWHYPYAEGDMQGAEQYFWHIDPETANPEALRFGRKPIAPKQNR